MTTDARQRSREFQHTALATLAKPSYIRRNIEGSLDGVDACWEQNGRRRHGSGSLKGSFNGRAVVGRSIAFGSELPYIESSLGLRGPGRLCRYCQTKGPAPTKPPPMPVMNPDIVGTSRQVWHSELYTVWVD